MLGGGFDAGGDGLAEHDDGGFQDAGGGARAPGAVGVDRDGCAGARGQERWVLQAGRAGRVAECGVGRGGEVDVAVRVRFEALCEALRRVFGREGAAREEGAEEGGPGRV